LIEVKKIKLIEKKYFILLISNHLFFRPNN
jgi:hypothetical protein